MISPDTTKHESARSLSHFSLSAALLRTRWGCGSRVRCRIPQGRGRAASPRLILPVECLLNCGISSFAFLLAFAWTDCGRMTIAELSWRRLPTSERNAFTDLLFQRPHSAIRLATNRPKRALDTTGPISLPVGFVPSINRDREPEPNFL